jgi:VanZ family protein
MRNIKINTVLLILWTLILLGLLLSPIKESLIPSIGGFQHWDKVAHFCLFAITGFISIYGASFFSRFRARVLFGLVFGLILAVGTELGQYLIPFRDPEFSDLLADFAGLFLGLLSGTLLYCWKLRL